MSGWNDWGIKRKLFAVIVLLLALQVVVLLCAGSSLFELFYTATRTAEMKERVEQIRDAYDGGSETFYDQIDTASYENVLVTLYELDEDGGAKEIFHSKWGRGRDDFPQNRNDFPPAPENGQREEPISPEIGERLRVSTSALDIQVDRGMGQNNGGKGKDRGMMPDGAITVVTRLGDNLCLMAFTPRGYIKSTADLAVKYTAELSIIILLIGAVAIYFVVGRLTRPIQRIQGVADKIARLDFTEKCDVTGNDEISLLGKSINGMSRELETAIEKLVSANEVLKSDLERQQKTERIRRQFIADVSHDFKTPLTLMVSYAEALGETKEGQEKEYCDVIISEGNRLSAMVGKLLELSRLENGADPVEKSIFCLSEIVDEAVNHHKLLTQKKRLTVTRALEEDFIVLADFQKIVRVVTNLFENAVKYTPEGGKITVRAKRMDRLCRLEVENTGEPIAADHLERLFESFYRADQSRGSGQGSYGIGLATVRAVMEAHEMGYGVENTDEGVRFWIELETADFDEDDDVIDAADAN